MLHHWQYQEPPALRVHQPSLPMVVHSYLIMSTVPFQLAYSHSSHLHRLTGSSPFLGPTQDATVTNISSCHLDTDSAPYSTLSSHARDFIQYRALVRNPRRRLTAIQCQRHHWVQSPDQRRSSIDLLTMMGRRGSEDGPHPQKQYSGDTSLTSKRLSLQT